MTYPQQPLVSIIVPVYERTAYILDAVQSALGQSLGCLEVIVTDDCSKRDVLGLLKSIEDPRLKARRNPENLGIVGNLRRAISESSGEYIVILNDDDLLEPSFLENLLPAMQADSRIVIAFCDHWIVDALNNLQLEATEANTRRWMRHRIAPGYLLDLIIPAIVNRSIPAVMGSIFRRDSLSWDTLPEPIGSYYDYWLACQVAGTGRPGWYCPKRLVRYRVHELSETHRLSSLGRDQAFAQSMYIWRRILSDGRLISAHPHVFRRATLAALRATIRNLARGRTAAAKAALNGIFGLMHERFRLQ